MSIKFEELPDTITPDDYAKWRGIGIDNARNYFHSKGFPRITSAGNRLIADKRAVLMYDLKLESRDLASFINKNKSNDKMNTHSIMPQDIMPINIFNDEQTFTIKIKRN